MYSCGMASGMTSSYWKRLHEIAGLLPRNVYQVVGAGNAHKLPCCLEDEFMSTCQVKQVTLLDSKLPTKGNVSEVTS
jgi:hypothetical protein